MLIMRKQVQTINLSSHQVISIKSKQKIQPNVTNNNENVEKYKK
jgi:hypothetical protein